MCRLGLAFGFAVCLLGLVGGWLSLPAWAGGAPGQRVHPRIALIIDDLGNQKSAGERALALPGPVTYAFLPHTPFAWRQASRAHAIKRQVMLHLPMESDEGNRLGAGALTLTMGRKAFLHTLGDDLDSVPYVEGINNHMGSLLTRDPTAMRWLMASIRETGLFFIDSRTTRRTVAAKVAKRNLIPTASRNVFLDNRPERRAILSQLDKLIEMARQQGKAIGIGHPYPQTLSVLEQEIPRLTEKGIELVPVSKLIDRGNILWHASSSPLPRAAKNSKQSPSPIY